MRGTAPKFDEQEAEKEKACVSGQPRPKKKKYNVKK